MRRVGLREEGPPEGRVAAAGALEQAMGLFRGRLGSERSARLTTESVRAPVGPGRTGRLPNLKVEEELGVPLLRELCTHEVRNEARGEIHRGFPGEDLAARQSLDVPSPMAFRRAKRSAPRWGYDGLGGAMRSPGSEACTSPISE